MSSSSSPTKKRKGTESSEAPRTPRKRLKHIHDVSEEEVLAAQPTYASGQTTNKKLTTFLPRWSGNAGMADGSRLRYPSPSFASKLSKPVIEQQKESSTGAWINIHCLAGKRQGMNGPYVCETVTVPLPRLSLYKDEDGLQGTPFQFFFSGCA